MSSRFPVLTLKTQRRKYVPWEFVEPLRARVFRYHGQTLERIAERGGLSVEELAWHLDGCSRWDGRPSIASIERVRAAVLAQEVTPSIEAVVATQRRVVRKWRDEVTGETCPSANCPMCNGEACEQHQNGERCECDVIERHTAVLAQEEPS